MVVSASSCSRRSRGTKASASRWAIPAVGSSSSRSRGRASTMEARSTTRRVPVESWAMWWRRNRSIPNERMTSSAASRLIRSDRAGPRHLEGGGQDAHRPAGILGQPQHLFHAELGEEPAVLEGAHHAEGRALLGQVLDQALAVQPDRAGLGRHQPRDDVEHGGLARAVGPDQPDDGARARRTESAPSTACTPPKATRHPFHSSRAGPAVTPPSGPLNWPPRWPTGDRRSGGSGCPGAGRLATAAEAAARCPG